MSDTKQMHKIFDLSVQEIESVLGNKRRLTDKTQLSIASLGVYSRLKSAEVHEEALRIMMLKHRGKRLR